MNIPDQYSEDYQVFPLGTTCYNVSRIEFWIAGYYTGSSSQHVLYIADIQFYTGATANSGWLKDNGRWHYLNASGQMVTNNWVKDNGKWYYMDASGTMVTGWKEINGAWYYMDANGVMATGKVTIDGKVNVFDSNGVWQGYAD